MTTVEIPLSKGAVALVDEADAGRVLAAGPWHLSTPGRRRYAAHSLYPSGCLRMHTFLTGWTFVDHINADGLDNRRSNLRPASRSQNNANNRVSTANTSGYKGVSFHRPSGLWRAHVGSEGTRTELGYFKTAEEAALGYDRAAIERWGEYARPNFPTIERTVA